jgi:magnesium-transporting ATPase (P-type)
MLLLTGNAVVDESSLTGEATQQAKATIDPFSRRKYDPVEHKGQTLFAGTRVLECDSSLALEVRTASCPMKGELMRKVIAFRTHRLQLHIELPIDCNPVSIQYSRFLLCALQLKSGTGFFAVVGNVSQQL